MADNIFGNLAPTNQDFDTGWHTLGALAGLSEDANLVGGRARWPTSSPGNFLWLLYRADTQQIVAQANLLTAVPSPTLNAWNEFSSASFQTPGDVPLDSSLEYVVAVATNGDFLYRTGFSYPIGSGLAVAPEGRFHNGGSGAVFPNDISSSVAFFADLLVEAGAPPPQDGTPAVWRAGVAERKWDASPVERNWAAGAVERKWTTGPAEGG